MTLHESRYPRIPYGLANFQRIRMERRVYVDKTRWRSCFTVGRWPPARRWAMVPNTCRSRA